MADPKVSKNAKTNRGANTKYVLTVNGKDVEICPAQFIGKTAGFRNYMAVQDKASKALICDEKGNPLEWNLANKRVVKA